MFVAVTKDKLCPRFASNGICMKVEVENLQGNGLENDLGASQDKILRGVGKEEILTLKIYVSHYNGYSSLNRNSCLEYVGLGLGLIYENPSP